MGSWTVAAAVVSARLALHRSGVAQSGRAFAGVPGPSKTVRFADLRRAVAPAPAPHCATSDTVV